MTLKLDPFGGELRCVLELSSSSTAVANDRITSKLESFVIALVPSTVTDTISPRPFLFFSENFHAMLKNCEKNIFSFILWKL